MIDFLEIGKDAQLTVLWFFAFHEISEGPRNIQNLMIIFLEIGQDAQFASQNP